MRLSLTVFVVIMVIGLAWAWIVGGGGGRKFHGISKYKQPLFESEKDFLAKKYCLNGHDYRPTNDVNCLKCNRCEKFKYIP